MIPVTRSVGAGGTVTIHYLTFGGNAVPGVDYLPVSGMLTFANGQTTQMIVVPVIANPHDNHDEYVGLGLDSPTQGAALGSAITSFLRIHDTDPDFTPPQVSNVEGYGTAAAITSIVVTFSEPIAFSSSVGANSFQIQDLGTNGSPAAPGGPAIGLSATPMYNPVSHSVTLVPAQALAAGHWYRVQVSGTGVAPIQDLAGNLLAGASPGMPGTDDVVLFGRGTSLVYYDRNGDLVTLKVTGGGYLDEVRDASGEGQVLTLQGGVFHKTTLSGSVVRKGRGNGMTSLGTIEGLGQFGDIRVKLTSPPFTVRQYPFFLGHRGRSLGSRALVPTPAKHQTHPSRH
jgi:hypothetical protein